MSTLMPPLSYQYSGLSPLDELSPLPPMPLELDMSDSSDSEHSIDQALDVDGQRSERLEMPMSPLASSLHFPSLAHVDAKALLQAHHDNADDLVKLLEPSYQDSADNMIVSQPAAEAACEVEAATESDDEKEEEPPKKRRTARRSAARELPTVTPASARAGKYNRKAKSAAAAPAALSAAAMDDDDDEESSSSNRSKHSESETRRRTRLRNQFSYLAEAAESEKKDRYSILCAAIVKIEAFKRRLSDLETQLASQGCGAPMAPASLLCAESTEYGMCSQLSGVPSALLSGDGSGRFLAANHRFLSMVHLSSLEELQSRFPSLLHLVDSAELSTARNTLQAVSMHKHGSMTLPLDSNTILAFRNHSDDSIGPAVLHANLMDAHMSYQPAVLTLSSYEHGRADCRRPCVLLTAVPAQPLPAGVQLQAASNDRLAHRGRKAQARKRSRNDNAHTRSASDDGAAMLPDF